MMGIITRYLRDKQTAFIGFTLGAFGFFVMYLSIFPSLKDQAEQLSQVFYAMPEAFLKAFGMTREDLMFGNVESFLATEMFSFVWPIMAIIFAVGLANHISANDIERGTVELVLSKPISRVKLFLSRYFAGLFYLLAFTLISVYGTFPVMNVLNIEYNVSKFNNMVLIAGLFALAVYSLATLFSALFSERGKVGAVMGGLLILMYSLNVVSGFRDSLSDLKFASFFYYLSPAQTMTRGNIVDYAILVYLGVALLSLLVAVLYYNKRDLV